jgi:hypothetical protein
MNTVEPLVSKPSPFKVEIAIENVKRYKSPGIDQIPAEMIQAGGNSLCSQVYRLIISI